MDERIVVVKRNLAGEETWRYEGRVLERGERHVRLEAFFNRPDLPFHGIVMRFGDRFVETFYSDRWYNIFEFRDKDDDRIKGWYCNITRPAVFADGEVSYVDLALDLLVYPDGRQLVLDEDEFEQLSISDEDRQNALDALRELQAKFAQSMG